MLDQFTLPASAIWIASAPNEKGDTHVAAAFASAHHAVEFVEHTVSPGGRGWMFTIDGQTVPASAFVTADHAFEWVLATSIYGSWEKREARRPFAETAAGQAFIASGPSRETSPEIMRAIAFFARNLEEATDLWEEGPHYPTAPCTPTDIWERVTNNGMHDASEFVWGVSGNRWHLGD